MGEPQHALLGIEAEVLAFHSRQFNPRVEMAFVFKPVHSGHRAPPHRLSPDRSGRSDQQGSKNPERITEEGFPFAELLEGVWVSDQFHMGVMFGVWLNHAIEFCKLRAR